MKAPRPKKARKSRPEPALRHLEESSGPPTASVPAVTHPLVTLTTDIGWSYASQMKAVLLRDVPNIRIVDITHDVTNHQVVEGAFLLRYSGCWFPPGTIHVAIVDPEVGGVRAPIAISCSDGSKLLGPDNGILSPLAEYLGEPRCFRLVKDRFSPTTSLSNTFHGRDLFAPAAARIAQGVPLESLGDPADFFRFQFPKPVEGQGFLSLMALHVDHFGNVITNVPTHEFMGRFGDIGHGVAVHVENRVFRADILRTYDEIPRGALGAIGSSFGFIELAINHGKAKDVLGLRPNQRFDIRRI